MWKGFLFGIFPSIILALFITYLYKSNARFKRIKYYVVAVATTHLTAVAVVLFECWQKNILWPKKPAPPQFVEGLPYGCGTVKMCDYFALKNMTEILFMSTIAAFILIIVARKSLKPCEHLANGEGR
ncbi:MAG: hypothetical protein C0436_02100 [Alphaproteobacteria bacterium]|nr:hypothetical protein [Alphaproteobacteria bacterium]